MEVSTALEFISFWPNQKTQFVKRKMDISIMVNQQMQKLLSISSIFWFNITYTHKMHDDTRCIM